MFGTCFIRNILTILMIMMVPMVIIVVNCNPKYQTQPSHSENGPNKSFSITPAFCKKIVILALDPGITWKTMVTIQVAMRREWSRVRMFLLIGRTVEK